MTLPFTGREFFAFGRTIPATCVVRTEVNGWRKRHEVVLTGGQTTPHGVAYYPRQFPPGEWEITRVVDMGADTAYWPVFMDTAATQTLRVWDTDENGYYSPKMKWITGRGYGIHHARYSKDGVMVKSNTTLGCINIASPGDAEWLGEQIRGAIGMRQRVYIDVPKWADWK